MSKTFEKAPLVETIAELRWTPQAVDPQIAVGQGTPSVPLMALNSNTFDEFFMRFGGEIYQHGFQRAERLIPPGFPMMLFQPVYRYQKADEANASALYQLGAGLFSANAIPPYKSWEAFSPTVEAGVEALLKTRPQAEKDTPFSSVSLRYIDAFGPHLTEGRDVGAFIMEVFGVKLELPAAITKHGLAGTAPKPFLQISLPLENQLTMNVNLGEGIINNEQAIIMDTTIATTVDVPANKRAIVDALTCARNVMHEMFVELTKPIASLMQPKD